MDNMVAEMGAFSGLAAAETGSLKTAQSQGRFHKSPAGSARAMPTWTVTLTRFFGQGAGSK